jgi:serine/threonine protein kinase
MSETPVPVLASAPSPDMSGRKLGDYHLLRRLGRGGMAEVYLAEQDSLRRQVAIKVLKPSLALHDIYVRRFHHEARAAAKLVHANIVQIYEVGCVEGVHFIAQEYVAGQNLKQLLARSGTLDARLAFVIMRQVAAALQKAADQGIVHRDIKPENIMLSPSGEVKVADFGLARVAQTGQQVDLTQVGVTMGTPLYMSPEQITGGNVDPRSDLYSLGVTCYQMLSGRPPFEAETSLALAMQHLKHEPRRLEDLRPDLPPALCRIVHKLLAKDPAHRFARPADLLAELRALQLEQGSEGWLAGLEEWTVPELAALAATQTEATLKLESLLRRQSGLRPWQPAAPLPG